jgi:GDPmannose 4,6-dehydratase
MQEDESKRALIFGVTGQDGSYLAELLVEKGYEVFGVVRRSSTNNRERLNALDVSVDVRYGDLSDSSSIRAALEWAKPTEVYNLAAMSDVKISFDVPEYTADVTGAGTVRVLEAIRQTGENIRFYQASSSEMFGSAPPPQNETTPFHPRSPYGCAKVYSYYITQNYREAYGMHASNGILFNHESPRRGENFVTRKIAKAVARISAGEQDVLYLGNLDAYRDWGFAGDYVKAMWLMLQQNKPDDYVVATGTSFTVRDFVQEAFSFLGLDWKKYVRVDPALFRPTEVDFLLGDPSKAKEMLGWVPEVDFKNLVQMMVSAEIE